MIRCFFLLWLLFLGYAVAAQGSLRRSAGEELLPIGPIALERGFMFSGSTESVPLTDMLFSRAPAPKALDRKSAASAPFDYDQSKPYLAFFCRLELNLEQATRIPVRFRLGEVRSWQQELSKRD